MEAFAILSLFIVATSHRLFRFIYAIFVLFIVELSIMISYIVAIHSSGRGFFCTTSDNSFSPFSRLVWAYSSLVAVIKASLSQPLN